MTRRPILLLAAALALPAAGARAAPRLLLSAEVAPSAAAPDAASCPVLLSLRNTTRQAVSIIGRLEGRIGDTDFPSFRTYQFDNVRPGSVGTAQISFDGGCAGAHPAGEIIVRGLLMCHQGLTTYLDCHDDIGAEQSAGAGALRVVVDITDWDPGGMGGNAANPAAPASPPAR